MPTATIKFSPEFLVEAMKRCRAQNRARLVILVIKLVSLAILAPIALWLFLQGYHSTGIGFALVSVFMFYAQHLDFWWAKHSFRKSPYLNDVLAIEFSEGGFHARSPKQDVKLQWSVFTKVVHFKDGFLIFQGPGAANWIPISSLGDSAQAIELEMLLREKVREHKTATT